MPGRKRSPPASGAGKYVLTRKADADIEAIAWFSLEQWGAARAEAYVLGLHEAMWCSIV
jgi:plasmid stabilization system protein ParE